MFQLLIILSIVFVLLGLNKQIDNIGFIILFLFSTFLVCFRYGQGSDYFGYAYNYSYVSRNFSLVEFKSGRVHGEIGFYFIQSIFRYFNLSFELFVGIIALLSMACIYFALKRDSDYKTLSFALFLPTFYFTYIYSGIREGLVLSIVLAFLIPAIIQGNNKRYIVIVIILSTIHSSALILLLPIVIKKIHTDKNVMLIGSIIMCPVLVVALRYCFPNNEVLFSTISVNGIVIRTFYYLIVTLLYNASVKRCEVSDELSILYEFYHLGFCVFGLLSPMAILSQRLSACYKIVEIVLIPNLIILNLESVESAFKIVKRNMQAVVIVIVTICAVESCKNIESYAKQGDYNSDIHFYNYPYISIWNENDIFLYRSSSRLYEHIND